MSLLDELLGLAYEPDAHDNVIIQGTSVQYSTSSDKELKAYFLSRSLIPKYGHEPSKYQLDNGRVIYAIRDGCIFEIDDATDFPIKVHPDSVVICRGDDIVDICNYNDFERRFEKYQPITQIDTFEDLFTSPCVSDKIKDQVGKWFQHDRQSRKTSLIELIKLEKYIKIDEVELKKLEPEQLEVILKYYAAIHQLFEDTATGAFDYGN